MTENRATIHVQQHVTSTVDWRTTPKVDVRSVIYWHRHVTIGHSVKDFDVIVEYILKI